MRVVGLREHSRTVTLRKLGCIERATFRANNPTAAIYWNPANTAKRNYGTVVHTMPKGDLVTDGICGISVNHLLNVDITGFGWRNR